MTLKNPDWSYSIASKILNTCIENTVLDAVFGKVLIFGRQPTELIIDVSMQSIKGKSKHLATPWLPAVFLVRQVVCLFQPLLARQAVFLIHSPLAGPRAVYRHHSPRISFRCSGSFPQIFDRSCDSLGWWFVMVIIWIQVRWTVFLSPTDMTDCDAFNGLVPLV